MVYAVRGVEVGCPGAVRAGLRRSIGCRFGSGVELAVAFSITASGKARVTVARDRADRCP